MRASSQLLRASRPARRALASFAKTQFRAPDASKPRIVLAYSGGLDTSTQLAYLAKEKGFEVCAYIADLGQDDVKTQVRGRAKRGLAKRGRARGVASARRRRRARS